MNKPSRFISPHESLRRILCRFFLDLTLLNVPSLEGEYLLFVAIVMEMAWTWRRLIFAPISSPLISRVLMWTSISFGYDFNFRNGL
jgi:cytochrome c oxidase subunit IV